MAMTTSMVRRDAREGCDKEAERVARTAFIGQWICPVDTALPTYMHANYGGAGEIQVETLQECNLTLGHGRSCEGLRAGWGGAPGWRWGTCTAMIETPMGPRWTDAPRSVGSASADGAACTARYCTCGVPVSACAGRHGPARPPGRRGAAAARTFFVYLYGAELDIIKRA